MIRFQLQISVLVRIDGVEKERYSKFIDCKNNLTDVFENEVYIDGHYETGLLDIGRLSGVNKPEVIEATTKARYETSAQSLDTKMMMFQS